MPIPQSIDIARPFRGGPGGMECMFLLDFHSLDSNLYLMHRGVLNAGSGIGHHFHSRCEETFIILSGTKGRMMKSLTD